jgi:hypothetical protein
MDPNNYSAIDPSMALREIRRPYNAQEEQNAIAPLYYDAPWPAELEMETIRYRRPGQRENVPLNPGYYSRTLAHVRERYRTATIVHGQTENQIYMFNVREGTYQVIEFSAHNDRVARRALARQARITAERYRTHQIGQIYPREEFMGLIQRYEYRTEENGEIQHHMRPQVLRGRVRMPEPGRVMRYENGARIRDHNVYRQMDWSHARDWDGYVGNEMPALDQDEDEPQGDWQFEDGDGGDENARVEDMSLFRLAYHV